MRRSLSAVAAFVLLSGLCGCGIAQRREYQQAIARCNQSIPVQVGHYVEFAACLRNAETQAGKTDPGNSLFAAKRADVAARVDKGEISVKQAELKLSQLKHQLAQEQALRSSIEAAAAAQASAARSYSSGMAMHMIDPARY